MQGVDFCAVVLFLCKSIEVGRKPCVKLCHDFIPKLTQSEQLGFQSLLLFRMLPMPIGKKRQLGQGAREVLGWHTEPFQKSGDGLLFACDQRFPFRKLLLQLLLLSLRSVPLLAEHEE